MKQARWINIVLAPMLLVASGCIKVEPPSPPQVPVVPNASLITANVLKYSIWDSELLGLEPSFRLCSLVLKVLTSEPVSPDLASLIKPGDEIEAFTKEALGPEFLGQKVKAMVTVVGDEHGQRVWLESIQTLKSS